MRLPARQIRIRRKALFRQPAPAQHRTNSHQSRIAHPWEDPTSGMQWIAACRAGSGKAQA
ncbi:hypothetical protein EN792_018505 [Mesorhizobium sp. M00.F.Ca.ET.149.01.1.1]|nr:hypothetical protein EN840_21970 [Mesorhizobium sp. M8A.F.Ca.ET.197.01.1.1]TGR39211.1 hypothetical protein EN842_42015 [bacterium M00.F.Ca.ET.199.01.1.1]TGR46805.1 hypothetical protein EN841_21965 [Mesorhizobium sp. M8A.F.Ca.ET.198.01.1.1]TGV85117.1 hypothetical protein EN792_018505 [Mesorhizobium sp. M00.F.Ca.ET.149.01.1.1]